MFLLFLSLLFTVPAIAQVNTGDRQKTENIKQLMTIMGADKLREAMLDQLLDGIKRNLPPADQDPKTRQAIDRFERAGVRRCVLVEGGTAGWVRAGLPVEMQAGASISLERQVRIVAGALVLIGTLLGFFWNRFLLGLPAFVGGGLLFAGLTDTCGMGMLLARMPWNRAGAKSCECNTPTAN